MSSWILLTLAILFEVAGTTCMKLSDGLTRLWPVVGIVVFYLTSIAGLALALKRLDVSVAYAVWAGLGIVLITLVGIFFFNEPMTPLRAVCITLILLGVIGLNLSHP
jgi:small multidrug resistance pump